MTQFDYSDLPTLEECEFTKRILFVDLETTGFSPEYAGTASVGAVLMGIDGQIEDEFYAIICPTDAQMSHPGAPGAFKVNGFSPEELKDKGRPAEDVWTDFGAWLKDNKVTSTKVRYVGQNPKFDLAFIQAEAPQLVKKYGFVPHRALDIIDLYGVSESRFIVPFISGEGKRKGKSGNSLAKALQVEGEPEVHNALEGARLNWRNFTRLAQINRRWAREQS